LFLRAEAKPQALEWCFAQAANVPFSLSMDNLDTPTDSDVTAEFARAVASEVDRFAKRGLPPRGQHVFDALGRHSGLVLVAQTLDFSQESLR